MVQEDALVDWRSSHKSHKQIQTIKNDMYTCYIQWYDVNSMLWIPVSLFRLNIANPGAVRASSQFSTPKAFGFKACKTGKDEDKHRYSKKTKRYHSEWDEKLLILPIFHVHVLSSVFMFMCTVHFHMFITCCVIFHHFPIPTAWAAWS